MVDQNSRRPWQCSACGWPKRNIGALDATIQGLRAPSDPPLNFVYGFGIHLIRRDLLLSLGEDTVSRDLWIGQVFRSDGEEIASWATFRGRVRLVVRGSKDAGYRICPRCKRILYSAMGSQYLCPAPPVGTDLFESDLSGLIVSEVILRRVQKKITNWPKLRVQKLPVLAQPKDGLPIRLG